MMDPISIGVIAASVLGVMAAASWTGLKAWGGWLDYKRLELTHGCAERTLPPASGRIEIADLKERIRKLEAIAAGIDIE